MLYDEVEDADEMAVDDLLDRFAEELSEAAASAEETIGMTGDGSGDGSVVEHAALTGDLTELTGDLAESIEDLTVEEATTILSAPDDSPSAELIEAEIRDDLLLGMSSAILDVEALAARVDLELSPREIQQKVEGRSPMTLHEYAAMKLVIERRSP